MVRPTLLLAGFAAITVAILAGCSDTRVTVSGDGIAAPARSEKHKEDKRRRTAIGKAFATLRWTTAS